MFKKYNYLFIAALILIMSISFPINAQDSTGVVFAVDAGYSVPTASFNDATNSGFGGNATIWLPYRGLNFGVTAGYTTFTTDLEGSTAWTIPLSVVAKWYIFENAYLSGAGMVGFDRYGYKDETANIDTSETKTSFEIVPGIGYEFKNLYLEATYRGIIDGLRKDENERQNPRYLKVALGYLFR